MPPLMDPMIMALLSGAQPPMGAPQGPPMMDPMIPPMGGSPMMNPMEEGPMTFQPSTGDRLAGGGTALVALLGAILGKKNKGMGHLAAGMAEGGQDVLSQNMQRKEQQFLKEQERDLSTAHEHAARLSKLRLEDPEGQPGKYQNLREWLRKYNEYRANGKGLSPAEAKKLFLEMGRHGTDITALEEDMTLGSARRKAEMEQSTKEALEMKSFFDAMGTPQSGEGVGLRQWRDTMSEYQDYRKGQFMAKTTTPITLPDGRTIYVPAKDVFKEGGALERAKVRALSAETVAKIRGDATRAAAGIRAGATLGAAGMRTTKLPSKEKYLLQGALKFNRDNYDPADVAQAQELYMKQLEETYDKVAGDQMQPAPKTDFRLPGF